MNHTVELDCILYSSERDVSTGNSRFVSDSMRKTRILPHITKNYQCFLELRYRH